MHKRNDPQMWMEGLKSLSGQYTKKDMLLDVIFVAAGVALGSIHRQNFHAENRPEQSSQHSGVPAAPAKIEVKPEEK